MTVLLRTRVTAIGPEVADLAEGRGHPVCGWLAAELAEVPCSTRRSTDQATTRLKGRVDHLGPVSATITAVGSSAWSKVLEMGHVVISFNGATEAERPGEICASQVDAQALVAALKTGAVITIAA